MLQPPPRLEDLSRHPPLVPVALDLPQDPVQLPVQPSTRLVDHEVKVCSSVHLHQRPSEVLDVVAQLGKVQGSSCEALEPGVCGPFPTSDGRHVLPGEAVALEVAPVVVGVAGLEEADVGFSDDNVVRSAVSVKLLVPLLQEPVLNPGSMALLDPVPPHDVEDFQSDRVSVSSSSRHQRDAHPRPQPRVGLFGIERGKGKRDAVLSVGQVLGLIVGVAGQRDKFHLVES
mmetsp:Transcript_8757/g.29221  ORF Transcript_8757/g.29221 Transcript_8757/m.29221 type:complete len:229 (-) Transcript_8757:690-1376(-)